MTIIVAQAAAGEQHGHPELNLGAAAGGPAPEPQPYCSYTLQSQPAATSTFSSSVFVPSISSELYGGAARGQVSSKYCGF